MSPVSPFSRLETFVVAVPAGTARANPAETAMIFNPGEVVGIRIKIPFGHAGLTGLQIATGHVQVFPTTKGAFLQGDDDEEDWPIVDQSNTGAWSAIAYNTDIFAHSFYINFYVIELQLAGASNQAVVPPPLALP